MAGEDPQLGIDFTALAALLRKFRRGAISQSELPDSVASVDLLCVSTPICGSHEVMTTAASLYRRLLDSGAFDGWNDDRTKRHRLAAEVLIAVVLNTQVAAWGDLQLARYRDCGAQTVREFSAYWAAQLCDFIHQAPAELRVQLVDMTGAQGLDWLLPTALLDEILSATSHLTSAEFGHRRQVGTTMALRLAGDGDIVGAIKLAESFGSEAHHLLIKIAGVLPSDSSQWTTVIAALRASAASVLTDGDPADILYAAANAAHCQQPDAARALLAMAQLEQPTARDTEPPTEEHSANWWRQIELHALVAVILHTLGDDSAALRSAESCASLAATAPTRTEDDAWGLPKAAGWLLARAEEDPAARVRILKWTYCKYDSRGPLEGRLALQACTAYLELSRPELAAYFLSRATEDAAVRRINDHFPNSIRWDRVGATLESARVSEQELREAGAALRKLGYLPEPENGQQFWWIDEQWYRTTSDGTALVSPKPKRA